VGCLALVVGALAGRATVAQPVVETRLLAGFISSRLLTAGAKTQERFAAVVALASATWRCCGLHRPLQGCAQKHESLRR